MRERLTGLGFACVLLLVWAPSAAGKYTPFVTCSSTENTTHQPGNAVDGDRRTRWASGYSRGRTQWWRVDFGRPVPITSLVIHWEHAYAVEYKVQVSDDDKAWRTLRHKTDGKDESIRLDGLKGRGRYLRILGIKHGRWPLFSIWEIELGDAPARQALKEAWARDAEARRRIREEHQRLLADATGPTGLREIVFAVRTNAPDGHWYANFGYYAQDSKRKCYGSGGRLCKLDLATSRITTLVDDPKGAVRDPVVHYDGRRILFSWRKAGTDPFHLYEINADGGGLRQLTRGVYDDIEPTYLPDGGVMFVSSRCKRWVNCWLTQVAVLYRCDAHGANVRRISANIEHDNTPWVLPDGRVLYQRWEYVDRSQVNYHHLWTTNPDGTNQTVYFGNMHPSRVFIDAKPIPGTNDVVLINSPGHGRREHAGRIAVLTPKRGPDVRAAMRNISDEGFRDPYALSESLFLAARGNRIVLVDREGRTSDLVRAPKAFGRADLHEPRPIVRRARERRIPPRVDLTQATGRLVLADVHRGRNMRGVRRGEIKRLLVLETLPKPINYTGGMEPLTFGGSFTLERIVGAVPVEPDGSAHFELPADRAFFFVALDEHERSVKRMQSFVSVAPGEVTGCVGCHESRTQTPPATGRFGSLRALARAPSRIEPIRDAPDVFDYPRDIQPIVDRRCTRCHNPAKRSGGVLLTADRGPMYSHSYFALSARRQIADGRNRARSNYAPRTIGDVASPFVHKLEGGHHGVKATGRELRLARYWVNSGAPWPGTYAALGTGMIGGYATNRIEREDLSWPSVKKAMAVIEKRCASCHKDRRRLAMTPTDNLDFQPQGIPYDQRLRFCRHIVYNLSRPEASGLLLAPLSRKAGGWGMQARDRKGEPKGRCVEVFKNTSDPGFQAILAMIRRAKARLDEIKRFDMPGFKPRPEYVREMKRYGVLPPTFDLTRDPIDVYALERQYWRLFERRPARDSRQASR